MALLGEAHLLAGDRARAADVAARALDLARADGTPLNVGLARRALGRIHQAGGQLDAARDSLAEALATFAACGARFEAARTRVDLAAVQAARADTDAAREHLAAAVATFEAANAPRRAAAARELAGALGLEPPVVAGETRRFARIKSRMARSVALDGAGGAGR